MHCEYTFHAYADWASKQENLILLHETNRGADQAPIVYIFFSCSTQLSTKFILLINVKMPTIVGILTFISMIGTKSNTIFYLLLLAHLSRRLMGELIVYQSLRRPSVIRPSVRLSVRQHFQTSSPLKPLGQLNSNFIWRLLRTRERKFV